MSNISHFLKQNKKQREETTYQATISLIDENGVPLEWKIRPITTVEDNYIRESCTEMMPHPTNPNLYVPQVQNSKYLPMLLAKSVIEPNLNNAELQDSYGVKTPEELILEMLDNPGEYYALANFVQEYNGFKTPLQEKIEEVKN